jgi:uncharacterized protein with NAD-binding domain and iron-sulfur cluster
MAKKKVTVLGGGIAALSAAFELTELDRDNALFDITIYTLGWRLGGKGAVGRRGADWGHRAEEHGLHVWTGFYDNSFHLVDRCYDGLTRLGHTVPFGSRSAAFLPLDRCTLMEKFQGAWSPWPFHLPRRSGTPGKFDDDNFVSLVDYLQSLIRSSVEYLKGAHLPAQVGTLQLAPSLKITPERLLESFEAVSTEADKLPDNPREITHAQSKELQNKLMGALHALREYKRDVPDDRNDLRRAFILIELAFTIGVGMLADGVMWHGFDHIDDLEWSDWMRSHLCSVECLDSAIVRGCYDYVFGYLRGNRDVGAGTGTRVLLKLLFGYKGSFFYVMKATMGELVFAPLYQLLSKRGVKFEFFHRVDSLGLSPDQRFIETIEICVQAKTPGGVPYFPLITIEDGAGGHLATWPSHPKYELLENTPDIRGYDLESAWTDWQGVGRKTLNLNSDFDVVVLGISIGAFEQICAELVDCLPAWRNMVASVKTTPTMALQLWTTQSTEELGWAGGSDTILSGFAKPLDSWGDLTLMLPTESWAGSSPKGLAYFVGSFPELRPPPAPGPNPAFPKQELDKARSLALEWVETNLPILWSSIAATYPGPQWDFLFDPLNRVGKARFDAQFWRVNINPSDRYVLSVAGSVNERMTAGGSGIDNLYLAGDWVRTGINAGCVEASVMAGRAAAGAIRGVEIPMPNASDYHDFNLPISILPGLRLLQEIASRAAGGVGDIDAFCVIVDMPVADVRPMLPAGLKLLAPAAATTHSVVLVFARQQKVRPGFVPFGGTSYSEVFQIIPDLALENVPYLQGVRVSFMPHLLLDQLAPVVVGKNLYGFNKQLAQIRTNGDSFDVRGPTGRLGGHFSREGAPGDILKFSDIGAMRAKIEQPLVGIATDGSYICSIIDMHLDGATFQLATGTVDNGPPFTTKPASLTVRKAPGNGPWGFNLRSRWSLSLPLPVAALKGQAPARDARSLIAGYSQAMIGKFPFNRTP